MNEKLENILELPLGHRLGMLVGSLLLVTLVFWFAFYSSVANEIVRTNKKIMELNTKKSQQQGIVKNLTQYREKVAMLNLELDKALKELPDKKEIDQLLLKVSDRAKDSGLDIRLFKPRPEEKRDFYAAVPVDIEASGSYHQVATFFDEVGHLDRIVNLDNLAISDPIVDKKNVTLKTTVTATAFRFLDESERPQVEDQKEKKRRRK